LEVLAVGRELHEAVAVLARGALVPDELPHVTVEVAGQPALAIAGEGAVDVLAVLAQLHAAPGRVPAPLEADPGRDRVGLGPLERRAAGAERAGECDGDRYGPK